MHTNPLVSVRAFKQQGATLIVSLVILAVITTLGLASVRSSNLELKMAASARDRAIAFQRAEAALAKVEVLVEEARYTFADYMSSCVGNRCFKANCNNGLCFSGDVDEAVTKADCEIFKDDGVAVAVEHWRNKNLWDTANAPNALPTVSIATGGSTPVDVPYMIEFMCFVPRDDSSGVESLDTGVPLYRITVRAKGDANRSTVMLQSLVREAN